MADKSTPRPWHLLQAQTLINIKGPRGEQICQIPVADRANAELIVRAANEYDALRTENRRLREALAACLTDPLDVPHSMRCDEQCVRCKAEAALGKGGK